MSTPRPPLDNVWRFVELSNQRLSSGLDRLFTGLELGLSTTPDDDTERRRSRVRPALLAQSRLPMNDWYVRR